MVRVERLNLKEIIPDYYSKVVEFNQLEKSYQQLFEINKVNAQRVQDNASILICDEDSLRLYESMLRIVPNPVEENIEFRRMRIINRINSRPPFTLKFLIEKLNDIFGQNNYDVYIDYEDYTLYIESSVDSQNWYNEVSYTVNNIKPSNMVYIQVPLYTENIKLTERAYKIGMAFARVGYAKVGETKLESRMAEEEVTIQ